MNESETVQAVLDGVTVFLRLSMHDFTRYARSVGLSLEQINVLMHLYYRGPREVMAFGDFMRLSPAGTSQMVERLVQQGLVQRVESQDDRRVRLVHLTERGRLVVDGSIQARQQWVKQVLASLSDEQRTAVGQALRVLTEQVALLEAQPEIR